VLRPRVRLIADEHLSGAPREAVEARLDRWVKAHIEKLLGPLFALAAAEDVTGMARGVAFQLVEALGVLDRQRVADDVKGLDQPARATLRKYGVRFGAYHIYLPLLLKPAPRALATQLWALAHENAHSQGADDLLHLAAGGRTSMPVNKDIDPVLYRNAGYRVCGERAVRVDILERLADLIRPALAWREGASGAKPPGALPGGGFTVVNTMTSLTGASGEDFASILRSLGYRMEKRPKPAEPVAETPAAAPTTEPAVATAADATEGASDADGSDHATVDGALETPVDLAPVEPAEHADDTTPAPAVAGGVEATLQPEAEAEIASADEAAAVNSSIIGNEAAAPTAEAATAELQVAEPELIEVWRPGRAARSEGPRRPRFRGREGGRHGGRPAPQQTEAAGMPPVAVEPADATAMAASPTAPAPSHHHRHQRRKGPPDQRPDQRFDRPRRDRERPPPHAHAGRPERREKAPDPNSPFAKLAALKAQLEAEAKERR
jgi:ATP-dependent RNA helicase SUPV3L1/SUV3